MGKQAYGQYQESQGQNQGQNQGQGNNNNSHEGTDGGDYGIQGSARLNSNDNGRSGGNISFDHDSVAQQASNHAGNSGETDMFAKASELSFIEGKEGS